MTREALRMGWTMGSVRNSWWTPWPPSKKTFRTFAPWKEPGSVGRDDHVQWWVIWVTTIIKQEDVGIRRSKAEMSCDVVCISKGEMQSKWSNISNLHSDNNERKLSNYFKWNAPRDNVVSFVGVAQEFIASPLKAGTDSCCLACRY